MSLTGLYYKAPSDEIFNEVKEAALKIWRTYDDTYGYQAEKVDRIKDIGNIKDNLMYIVAMFDNVNQSRLASLLSEDAREAIRIRLDDGEYPAPLNPF